VQGERVFRDQLFIDVAPEGIRNVLRYLRDDPALEYRLLVELTCVDYLKMPDYARARFGITYVLHSLALDARVRLKVWVGAGNPEVPSVSDVFGGANWLEREIYDLYGVRFVGHPSLKRILLPDDYEGHPLRKDYPLKGRGERDSFPVITRQES
jgi:NADH-quinone oxidoreductase subunit C